MCKQIVYYPTMLPSPPAETRHASRVSRFGATEKTRREPYEWHQNHAHRSGTETDLVVASASQAYLISFVSFPMWRYY